MLVLITTDQVTVDSQYRGKSCSWEHWVEATVGFHHSVKVLG